MDAVVPARMRGIGPRGCCARWVGERISHDGFLGVA